MMDREKWISGILSVIGNIANAEKQYRAWVLHENICFPSLDEIYCQIFDDYDLDNLIDNYADQFGLTSQQKVRLNRLRNLLNSFDYEAIENIDIKALLDSQEWSVITHSASEVLHELSQCI